MGTKETNYILVIATYGHFGPSLWRPYQGDSTVLNRALAALNSHFDKSATTCTGLLTSKKGNSLWNATRRRKTSFNAVTVIRLSSCYHSLVCIIEKNKPLKEKFNIPRSDPFFEFPTQKFREVISNLLQTGVNVKAQDLRNLLDLSAFKKGLAHRSTTPL